MPELNADNRSLFTGDNLDILRGLNSVCVDLIYVDPPRNSSRTLEAAALSRAAGYVYHDKWTAEDARPDWEDEIEIRQPEAMQLINSFRLVCDEGVVNYLVFLTIRLLECQRVLKDTGSIYLQCRPDSVHYLKAIMDAIFGRELFKSDITFKRVVPSGGEKRWRWAHDSLLFYAGPRKHRWNQVPQPPTPEFLSQYSFDDAMGHYQPSPLLHEGLAGDDRDTAWRGYDPTAKERHWEVPLYLLERHYPDVDLDALSTHEKLDMLDRCGMVHWPKLGVVPRYKRHIDLMDGERLSDVVTTIGQIDQKTQEGAGWPGQVPKALLEIIILASSNEGDTILDPFSGSGTACVVAETLNRSWIAIERAPEGFNVLESRMRREANGTDIWKPMEVPWRTDQREPSGPVVGSEAKETLYEKQQGKCAGCKYELPIHVLTLARAERTQKAQATGSENLLLLCHRCNTLRGERDEFYLTARLYEEGILPH